MRRSRRIRRSRHFSSHSWTFSPSPHSEVMPAGENDARHIAASTAKARGSECYAAGNFAQVRAIVSRRPRGPGGRVFFFAKSVET